MADTATPTGAQTGSGADSDLDAFRARCVAFLDEHATGELNRALGIDDIPSCAEIIDRVMSEARETIDRLGALNSA